MKSDASTQSAHGRYRIQTVAELSGVPASTLRAWEQRYGFPAPERTASAYRLYTDADVARIVRVRALCDGGMAAAEAVAAVMREAGVPELTAPPFAVGTTVVEPAAPAGIDLAALDASLRTALVIAPAAVALAQTIEPQWQRLRDAWTTGALDRAEHGVAAEMFGHIARDLMRLGQPAAPRGVALLGGFGDDDDLVPLCRIALGCHARQVRTLLLGGRCSAGTVADGVRRWAPRLVALACVEPPTASRARELLDDLWRAAGGAPVVVCGPGVQALPALEREGLRLVADADGLAAIVDAACG